MVKKLSISFFVVCLFCALIWGQEAQQEDKEQTERMAREAAFNNRVDKLRNLGKDNIIRDRYKNSKIYEEKIKPIYRDLNAEERELFAPDKSISQTYSDILKNNYWKLTKLMLDKGCGESTEVVRASPHCIKYSMPGSGASFSFRSEKYTLKRLADLSFTEKGFETIGVLKHGILVNLGDEDIVLLDRKHSKLKTLVEFVPSEDFKKAAVFAAVLEKGISGSGLLYGSILAAETGDTYALRSIAYKGAHANTIDEITYDEFDFDERRDVLVVFRVVNLDPENSVTILWRMLENKKSPKLK